MNALQTHFWAVRDYLSPVLRESKFKEHGRITPEEFVAAGDFLTYKFPTWSWAPTGGASSSSAGQDAAAAAGTKIREFLPKDKQYLISRGVPCLRRVSQMEKAAVGGAAAVGKGAGKSKTAGAAADADAGMFTEAGQLGGKDDEWIGTHDDKAAEASGSQLHAAPRRADDGGSGEGEIADIPDDDEEERSGAAPQLSAKEEDDLANRVLGGMSLSASASSQGQPPEEDEDGIGDIPDIPDEDEDGGDAAAATAPTDDDDDLLGGMGAGVAEAEDPAMASRPAGTNKPLPLAPGTSTGVDSSNLISVRTYDCLITYDKYYQTPRMWLVGYDEHGRLLAPAQIFEDVSSDYAQKTVTIEPFPHSTTMSTASIHPCKHASVMKKVIERMNVGVVEAQKKAAAAAAAAAAQAGGAEPGAKEKKKGWSLPGAVKKVTQKGSKEEAPVGEGTSAGAADGPASAESVAPPVEGLRVDQYLLIFLKFMASIVPAIEIDATQAM